MAAHIVRRPPTNAQINGALHQNEGIVLNLADFSQFAFVVSGSKSGREGFTVFTGQATEIVNGQFRETHGAELEIETLDSPERMAFLSFLR